MKTPVSVVEVLESRIAPASVTVVNNLTATYTDFDGDHVTLKITGAGNWNDAIFTTQDNTNPGAPANALQLQKIDFNKVSTFDGTDITVSVTKAANGDGLAAIGQIDASELNLGKVTIKGDLGSIQAGDTSVGGTPVAVAALKVESMGRYGISTQGVGGTLESDIIHALGSLTVKRDVSGVFLNVTGGVNAKIGDISIGQSLIGGDAADAGYIRSSGPIGDVDIGRDAAGAGGASSGAIESVGSTIGNVTIKGALVGGNGNKSGSILASLGIGNVKIGSDVLGGAGTESGYVEANSGSLGNLTIGGSLMGGFGTGSGCTVASAIGDVKIGFDVKGGGGVVSGFVIGNIGNIGNVKIGGSLSGGTASQSGGIQSAGSIGKVNIGQNVFGSGFDSTGYITATGGIDGVYINGSLIGGAANDSGAIRTLGSDHNIGKVWIGHNLVGASLGSTASADFSRSGYVAATGMIGSFGIGGSVITGVDSNSTYDLTENGSVRAGSSINSFKIGRSVIGHHTAFGDTFAIFSAQGMDNPTSTTNAAFGNIKIGGHVEWGLFLGGYDLALSPKNGDAQIGKVTVGSDWISSSLVAGVQNSGGIKQFGASNGVNDSIIVPHSLPQSIAKINSITIRGNVIGDYLNTGYSFAFESNNLFPVNYNGTTAPNVPGVTEIGGIKAMVIYRF
ncbi:MAG: hypothetical protein QOD99_2561 [Chthoniobacter sp.]|jgi:hypothetical protein|nr:hypothetical protein [Chthoniobacter sp.]